MIETLDARSKELADNTVLLRKTGAIGYRAVLRGGVIEQLTTSAIKGDGDLGFAG